MLTKKPVSKRLSVLSLLGRVIQFHGASLAVLFFIKLVFGLEEDYQTMFFQK